MLPAWRVERKRRWNPSSRGTNLEGHGGHGGYGSHEKVLERERVNGDSTGRLRRAPRVHAWTPIKGVSEEAAWPEEISDTATGNNLQSSARPRIALILTSQP